MEEFTTSLAAYLKVKGDQLDELKRLAKVARHRPTGMCARNKERLQPFKDPEVMRRMMRLPLDVAKRLKDVKSPTIAQAQETQLAVLLELLCHLPMRVKNVASLDLKKHFQRPVNSKSANCAFIFRSTRSRMRRRSTQSSALRQAS